MLQLSKEEIKQRFANSTDFNEIFDAFQISINLKIDDVELYRQLFWNKSLSEDEIILFGEKLAIEFPQISFDIFIWMANVFETLFGKKDNLENAFTYYKKASIVEPTNEKPFIDVCNAYNQDLNIPPIENLIEFLKNGVELVNKKGIVYKNLSNLYQLKGDIYQATFYKARATEFGESDD
ncbi:MAG: hypothetical protein AAB255_04630 [Bacteroidota bacterium]